ncbi:MAG: hypothetical protein WBW73_10795 [Rhodoplanes sp.]
MTRKHLPNAAEFRRQMIELVRAGRRPEELMGDLLKPIADHEG